MLSLRETVFRRLRLQKKARRQKQNRYPRSLQLEDLETRKLLTAALYANVPEAAAYTLVYDLAIANDASYRNTTPVSYTTNNSASVAIGSFDRIAYYLELDTGAGLEYMYVSMDAFTSDASKIGLPHNVNNPVVFQQRVNNMNVVSNKPGIVTGTGITTGNIEFWPSNYNTSNAMGIPNASGTAFDFGDGGASTSAGYGSFQVHNHDLDGAGPGTAGQTLFAYNDWGGGSPGDGNDLGIGNRSSSHPDWTFANNTSSYTVKNLQILVRPFTTTSNEAPVNTVPGTQTVWVGQTIVFSTANGNAISVSDDSGPSGMLQMTLTANTGTLTLATISGLTFTTGDGMADTTLKFRGTQASIVAALNGLVYTSTTGGVGTLTIATDDLGSSGSNPSGDAAGRIDNGGFETPFVPNGSYGLFDESLVPPWSTTDIYNAIEIWGTGFGGVPAFEGRQFAEINAYSAGTLSTTVQPTAGRNTEFAFAHRARRLSNEQIRVTVTDLGADGILGGGNDTVLLNKIYTDGTTAWGSYQENLGFSTGNKLLLQFTAVNPPNGDQFQSFGNFLDGIRFGVIILTDTDTVTINNLAPPTVPTDTVAPAGATISEGLANGSAVGITAKSTDPNGDPITYSLTNNAGGRFAINPTTGVVTVADRTLLDGPGSHIITVQASDGTDPVRGISSANFTITVTNVNPTATLSNGGPVNEGSTGTVSFSNQFDPSTADSAFRYAFDFDNNGTFDSGNGTYAGSGSSASATVPASFLTDGNSTRTARGRIIDKDGGFTDYTTVITINNVAPTISLSGAASVDEGSPYTLNLGAVTDPGTDTVSAFSVDWGDGSVESFTGNPANTSKTHIYADGLNSYTIIVSLTDEDSGVVTTPYLVPAGTIGNQAYNGSLGIDFNVNTPIVVTQLGVFDSGSNGLAVPITARLYNRDTQAQLTSLVFAAGSGATSGTLVGGSRFLTLATPISLPAGFRGTIVAENYQGSEPNGNTFGGGAAWTTDSGSGTISFVGGARYGSLGLFPTNVDAGPVNRYAAGTFKFTPPIGGSSFNVNVANVAPSVANAGNVSVNEGSTVTNSGTWSDPGLDIVTLAASVGTVTKNADGTWSWLFNSNDGPDQSQAVTITATDSDGAATATTFALTVNNVAPSVANAGDVSVNEGSTVTNSGTWNDPGLDIVTLSASAGTVTKNADGTWNWSFNSNDGPDQSQAVTVTATDSDGGSTTTSFNLTVNNVAPDAVNDSYSTPQATLLTGNVITGGGADSDPAGANDPLTAVAVNGVASNVGQAIALSNGTLTANADGSFSYQPDTTFVGTESFTYTISDGDGGFDTATVTIEVNEAAGGSILTVVDTCCDGGTALLITGTSANDHIVVAPGSTSATLQVNVNGVISTVARPSGRIIVLGLAGNDNIQIAGVISNSVWLYGDEGDDRLNAGNVSPGGNLLFGGDGNDDLLGGNGRDVLIGGQGADKITANAGDDILIAGLTTHDARNSAAHEEFWCNVLHEWTELDPFATLVNRLRTGSGHTGANLLASVLDDNSANQIDQLQGSSGNDWFLLKSGEDKGTGQTEATN